MSKLHPQKAEFGLARSLKICFYHYLIFPIYSEKPKSGLFLQVTITNQINQKKFSKSLL